MNDLVKVINGKVVVSSKDVADKFGKVHRNVMRDISRLECSDSFRLLNFEQSSYISKQNKVLSCVEMTRDGFCFLAMGFTGKKAGEWKEAYIKAFNEMENSLIKGFSSTMEQLNALASKIEKDKDVASKLGRALSEYKVVKKDNEIKFKQAFEKAQLNLGFK